MSKHTRTQAGIKQQGLYQNLYQDIDMTGPSMDDMPSQAKAGASMSTQAKAAGYQDIYRNIQAMRDSEYKKDVARGAITSEFSGVSPTITSNSSTQKDVQSKGLYSYLLSKITPIKRPNLPYSVSKYQGLSGYLGKTMEKTAPGLVVALSIAIAYFLFRKNKTTNLSEESEIAEEDFILDEIDSTSRY